MRAATSSRLSAPCTFLLIQAVTDILGEARAVQLSEITLHDACVFAALSAILRILRQNGARSVSLSTAAK